MLEFIKKLLKKQVESRNANNKSALLDYLVYGEGTKRGVQRGVQKKGGYKKRGYKKRGVQKKGGTKKRGVKKKGGTKKRGVQKKGVQKKGGTKRGGTKKGGYKKVPKSFSRGPTEGTVEISCSTTI